MNEDPALRIVHDDLWQLVKVRQHRATAEVGDKIKKGLKRYRGQAPRYLFTGLLKCSECGCKLVMADDRAYCCSGYLNGRICSNGIRVKRSIVEARLLEGIQQDLLTDQAIDEFKKRLVRVRWSRTSGTSPESTQTPLGTPEVDPRRDPGQAR